GDRVPELGRDPRRTRECAAGAGALGTEHGFSFWEAGSNILGGWAMATSGAVETGTEQLRRGLLEWMATDSVTYQTYYFGLLAEVLAGQGRIREPLRLLEEALALVEQTGERLVEAELRRLRGEMTVRDRGTQTVAVARAEEDFHRAIEIARGQDAHSLELRAALSLARLYREHSRQTEAPSMLADCYNWFTEGFDTPDLREAKALLEEFY